MFIVKYWVALIKDTYGDITDLVGLFTSNAVIWNVKLSNIYGGIQYIRET